MKSLFKPLCVIILLSSWMIGDLKGNELSPIYRAEALFKEELYSDALTIYQNALVKMEEEDLHEFLMIRIAECLVALEEYEQVLSHLKAPLSKQNSARCHLLAVAHRHLQHYQQALDLCNIQLEMGLNYFYLNQFSQANQILEAIPSTAHLNTYLIAQIYLTRIALLNKKEAQAQSHVNTLQLFTPPHHPLLLEIAYLQGAIYALLDQDQQAIDSFEQALPLKNPQHCPWYADTLNQIGRCCLKLAHQVHLQNNDPSYLFSKAQDALNKSMALTSDETPYLALAEVYIAKARYLQDPEAYQAAQQLLATLPPSLSENGHQQALLLRAAAASTYQERESLYHDLIAHQELPSMTTQSWYLRGINHFEEGCKLQDHHLEQACYCFEQAAYAFDQAANFIEQNAQQLSGESEAFYYVASLIVRPLIDNKWTVPAHMEAILRTGVKKVKQSSWRAPITITLSLLLIQKKQWEEAEQLLTQLTQTTAQSPFASEAYFWKATCAEARQDWPHRQEDLQSIFHLDPKSPFAAPAYFIYYSYRDYVSGQRKALKHLQAMPSLFPKHPLTLVAYYLIGLNYKKDHIAEDGKIQQHKNLTAAIEAFHQAELHFDSLQKDHLIPSSELNYFIQARYRSTLERALANLAIAEESVSAKKQIYLNYAADVCEQMKEIFHSPNSLANQILCQNTYPLLLEENEFWLARMYIEQGRFNEANQLFDHMLEHYKQIGQTKGYFLSHVWYEKGKLSCDPATALKCFIHAEQMAQGLNPSQKLEIWIQQSLCYKDLHQLNEALRVLSTVINEEMISGLRLKAMFLRAEIYELQGKPELAIKQLEATTKRGGEWGKRAKEKLEQYYGY